MHAKSIKPSSKVVLYNSKFNTYCHEMFPMTWTNLKTSRNTFSKAMGNQARKTLQIDKNFLKLEYSSKTMQR